MNWVTILIKELLSFVVDMIKLPFRNTEDKPVPETVFVHPQIEPLPEKKPEPMPLLPRQRLYTTVIGALGTDASPRNLAPSDLACAETVNELYFKTFNRYIDTPGISTIKLFQAMKASKAFKATLDPLPGVIIISPTRGLNDIGHTGIFVDKGWIASNNSFGKHKGKLTKNYTIDGWVKSYRKLGIYYFEPI